MLGVLGSLIQARFVTPEDFGYFRQFGIVTGYVFFLQLGVFHALERWYPYCIGRGESDKAVAMAEVGQSWILIVTIPICAVFAALACVSFLHGSWKAGLGWAAQTLLVLNSLYGGFLNTIYRSGHDFKKVAQAQMWSVPASLLALPFFWVQSYVALFLRNVAGVGVTLWRLHKLRPVRLHWRFTWSAWLAVVKQGMPRFTAYYVAAIGLDTLTATIILKMLGQKDLGYWSFAIMVVGLLYQVPQALTAIYAPRIMELYGKTGSPRQCLALCRKPILYGMGIAVACAIGGGVGTKLLLPLVVPKYGATAGLICLLLAGHPLKMLEFPSSILSAMNWLLFLNVNALLGAGAQLACALVGIRLGWGLYGVAAGVLAGGALRMLVFWLALAHACRLERAGAA